MTLGGCGAEALIGRRDFSCATLGVAAFKGSVGLVPELKYPLGPSELSLQV